MIKKYVGVITAISILNMSCIAVQASCTVKYRQALIRINRDQSAAVEKMEEPFIFPPEGKIGGSTAATLSNVAAAASTASITSTLPAIPIGTLAVAAGVATPVVWPAFVIAGVFAGVAEVLGIFGDNEERRDQALADQAYQALIQQLTLQHEEKMKNLQDELNQSVTPRAEVAEMNDWTTAIEANQLQKFDEFASLLPEPVSPQAIQDATNRLQELDQKEAFCPDVPDTNQVALMRAGDFKLLMIGLLTQKSSRHRAIP